MVSGLGAAAVPAIGGAAYWPVWAAFLLAVVLVVALDAAYLPSRREIACRPEVPGEIPVGEAVFGAITVVLSRPRAVATVEAVVDLSDDLDPQPPYRGRFAGGRLRLPLTLRARRRGAVRVERVWLRLLGPSGLVCRVVVVPVDRAIEVLPNVRAARREAIRFFDVRNAQAGIKIEQHEGEGSEFDSLKEFRAGDDHRAIDWKATARHRTLLKRRFRAERDHQVILAVDAGRLMAARLGGVPKLDHALGAALHLAYVALRSGDRVGFFGFDERPRIALAPHGGVHAHAKLLRAAMRLEARETETNFTLGLTTLLQSLKRRSLVVVLTDFVDSVGAELMLENVRRLARRHVVLFVALSDPAMTAIEEAAPTDRAALHRAVIAGALRRERVVALETLRRMGVHAIDAAPERLGGEMIDRYLDLKRREVA
jgi:uncharacterized protein (DUF58 family)